jgi:hypothetical protein
MMKMMLGFLFEASPALAAARTASVAAATPDALRKSRLFIVDTLLQLHVKICSKGLIIQQSAAKYKRNKRIDLESYL